MQTLALYIPTQFTHVPNPTFSDICPPCLLLMASNLSFCYSGLVIRLPMFGTVFLQEPPPCEEITILNRYRGQVWNTTAFFYIAVWFWKKH